MNDIMHVQLSEIAELITKGTTPTTLGYEFQDKGVNFLKIECFDEYGNFLSDKTAHISDKCNEKLKRSQLKAGDILFSIAGAIGRVGIVTREMLPANTNQALAIIRISDDDVYLPYIKLILTSPIVRKQFERKKQGVAQLNVSLKDINELIIPLPNKIKQKEFTVLFNKISSIADLRRKELQKLDELIKARFVEMFGDPVLNPLKWRKAALEENAILLNGRAYKQEELLDTGKYPVLRVGNFFSNRGWYYSDLELEEDKYCDNGDLLYAWSASFGPQIWNGGKVIYHYHIWKVLVGEAYNKMFLCKLLEYVTASLMGDTHGIAMMHLTKSGMEKTEFIIPPLAQQEQFAEFVAQVDKSKYMR